MKTLVIIVIALIIWIAGIQGNLGSILAAIIDPASLSEQTGFAGNPDVNGASGNF